MSHEREFDRSHPAPAARTRDPDAAPNRATRSARLDAPAHPVASGLLHRQRDGNGVADDAEHAVERAARSSGAPLPDTLMRKFEGSLGADLSSVRVHTGGESAAAAGAVGAKAYTVGQDIHFNAGQFAPSSHDGEHLLAHEVAHTVQQHRGAPHAQYKLEVSAPGDALEVEADRAAAAMVHGRSTSVTFGSGVARKVMRDKGHGEGSGGHAEGGEAKAPGSPETRGGSSKGTWHLGEVKLGEKKVGYFDLGVSYAVDINYEAAIEGSKAGPKEAPAPSAPSEPSNSYDQKHGTAPAALTTGVVGGPGGASAGGVQAELKKELDGGLKNFKPALKGGLELSGKNLKIETSLEFETKWGPLTLATCPITFKIVKWEAGKSPEIAVVGASVAGTLPFKEWEHDGTKYKLECQSKFELEARPDLVEIGKYIAEHAAEMLAAEFLITAGLIAGGVLAIGGALYQIAKSDEFTERTEPEVRKCRAYCQGYHAAMRGEPMNQGEGAAEGYAAGKARLKEMEGACGVPVGAVAANAKNVDFYTQAWNKAWPQVKARMIASYWEEHYIEKKITGSTGGGSGFKTFKMLLDGWDRG
jgi:hypothetical protein